MREEYDLSKLKSRKNPYAAKLKRQVTIRMGDDVIFQGYGGRNRYSLSKPDQSLSS